MAAAPYKVSVTFSANGKPNKNLYLTASDVNGAYWLAPDGSADIFPSTQSGGYISDVLYTAAGTDTSTVSIFKNGYDTGLKFVNAANTGSILNRQSQSMKVAFNAGDKLKFVQNT
jgi:hypothetical protein